MQKLRNNLTGIAPTALFFLLLAQPLLDVASFWANRWNLTIFTTALRFGLFAVVVLYSFLITQSRKRTLFAYGVIGLFFLCHFAACLRAGSYSVFSDFANFIRIAQLPVFTFCFIDLFQVAPEAKKQIPKAIFGVLCVIVAVIALSYLVGAPVYTYDGTENFGIQGWFEVANAQSAIVVLIVPMSLYFAWQKKNPLLFLLTAVLGFANCYFFGTRFAYYSIFILGVAFLFVFLINREKRWLLYGFLLVLMIAAGLTMKQTAMYQHQQLYWMDTDIKQQWADDKKPPADEKPDADQLFPETEEPDGTEEPRPSTEEEKPKDPEREELLNAQRDYYLELYKPYCGDMIEHFGMHRVMQIYDGTQSISVLTNRRLLKKNFAALAWEDTPLDGKLFGFEYSTLVTEKEIYDLENDFNGVFYFVGYVGMALYLAFLAYFVVRSLVAILRDPKHILTVEFCTVGITLIMILLAAEFSGNVLRRPNVNIYLALFLAYIFSMTGKIFKKKKEENK